MPWPALKWSADDKYVARVTVGQQISVYELPSMGLVDKKSIKVDGVVDFEWCPLGEKDREEDAKAVAGKGKKPPRQNLLAFWMPEVANQPARVTVMEFPSRQIMRQKNLFNVTEVCAKSGMTVHIPDIVDFSVSYIGKTRATSCAFKSTATQRPRSPSSVIWRFSVSARRTSPWRSSS